METVLNPLIDNTVQCWGCPVFDRLFQIISSAAAAAYDKLAILCMIVFGILFSLTIFNVFWKNIQGGIKDTFMIDTLKPLVINSLIALALLSSGLIIPRLITQITFEPTAELALTYTQTMLRTSDIDTNTNIDYQPSTIEDTGLFRPHLRDTIIALMKTTITQFQSYIKLGFAIIDTAFSWQALLGVGALIKHIVLLIIGIYLSYAFFSLFIHFCFYFADVIIAMAFFAFLFPLGIVFAVFKGDGVPKWISGLGNGIGTAQIKKLINAIIGLAAAVFTYTVIIVIIAKFFTGEGASVNELINAITTGRIFEADLDTDNLENITIASCIVLVYITNYLQKQIPTVTSMIMKTFDVSPETKISESLAEEVIGYTKRRIEGIKTTVKTIVSGGDSSSKGGTP